MSPTFTPDRQTFRALVADVAARAKARLPEAVNGRIESAARLVLLHDVTPQDDGSILVGSSTDPLKTYRLEGTTCECQDFTRGQAPEGWCQHRIAAGIQKRVEELLAAQAEDQHYPGKLESHPPLPEAAASVNVRLRLFGHECQLTLRDSDESRLLLRLEELLAHFEVPQASREPQDRSKEWCPIHNVPLKVNHGKDGRTWLSHKTPEGWCKGR
jgi:hypothetical protein